MKITEIKTIKIPDVPSKGLLWALRNTEATKRARADMDKMKKEIDALHHCEGCRCKK